MEEYNNTLYDFLIQKCQKHANICYYQEKKKKKDNSSFVIQKLILEKLYFAYY